MFVALAYQRRGSSYGLARTYPILEATALLLSARNVVPGPFTQLGINTWRVKYDEMMDIP